MDLKRRLESLTSIKQQLLANRLSGNSFTQPTVKTKRLVAYVVVDDLLPPTSEELKDLLKHSLPEYMVPQSFVFIDKIPLSANGKVDIEALPEQDQERKLSRVEFATADNPVEEKLAKIWSSVLGVDLVSIHDNFFEIGGDSILSIQIIARAKEAEIHLTPKQVFQNLTIAELAKVAKTEQSITAEQGLITGDVPVTPIQSWLLERNLPNPDHWVQAIMLRVPRDLNLEILNNALIHLAYHHDALRAQFQKKGDTWNQYVVNSVSIQPIESYDFSALNGEQQFASLADKASEIHASLDIGKGRLLAAAYFEMDGSEPDNRLSLAVHHLAIDAVSWVVFLEDLETLYHQLSTGQVVSLPEKTTSFKGWSNALKVYAKQDELKSELGYWLSLPNSDVFDIPVDKIAGDNTEVSERKYTVALAKEETRALLKDVPPVYNTKIDDILLTAMAQTINAWTGNDILSLGMEGHGREQINDNIDLSRTIGWFTSYFPVSLRLATKHPGEGIKSIKEQIRKIPNRGVGYGILRYLGDDRDMLEKLSAVHRANILYNNLGQFNTHDQGNAVFKMTDESCGHEHDQTGSRSHVLEIDAMIIDNQLKLDWVYSDNLHNSETIENLANNFIHALRELIAHCQSPEAGGVSASDFPEANLDQDDLEDLLSILND